MSARTPKPTDWRVHDLVGDMQAKLESIEDDAERVNRLVFRRLIKAARLLNEALEYMESDE